MKPKKKLRDQKGAAWQVKNKIKHVLQVQIVSGWDCETIMFFNLRIETKTGQASHASLERSLVALGILVPVEVVASCATGIGLNQNEAVPKPGFSKQEFQ